MTLFGLGGLGRRSSIAAGAALTLVSTVLVVPGIVSTAGAAAAPATTTISGTDTCPAGTIAVVKYDSDGTSEYKSSQVSSGESVVRTTASGWAWSSPHRDVYAVLVKGGTGATSVKTYLLDPAQRSGVVDSVGLVNPGGQQPAISHITLCGHLGDAVDSGYSLTVVARYCQDYLDVTANRGRNNLQETFSDLGADSSYGTSDPWAVNPATEESNPRTAANCAPLPDWTFTLGTGYSGGTPADISVVTGAYQDTVTTQSTPIPQLTSAGTPDGSKTIAGARTITLSAAQAALAADSSKLWIQGGLTAPRAGNAGQLNGQQGTYAFAALRCSVDAFNGDNVEWIRYTGGAKHAYCYAYYVDKTDYGTITLTKKTDPAAAGAATTFTFDSNVSYADDGVISLTGGASTQAFVREVTPAHGTPWFFEENDLPSGWTLKDITCTSSKTGGAASTVVKDGRRVSISLTKGDDVVCTYTNTKSAVLVVHKVIVGDVSGAATSFPFAVGSATASIKGGASATFSYDGVDAAGKAVTVAEGAAPEGWVQAVAPYCTTEGTRVDGSIAEGVTPTVKPGQTTDCYVTNRYVEGTVDSGTATVTVVKRAKDAGELGFGFTATTPDGAGESGSFSLRDQQSRALTYTTSSTGRHVSVTEDGVDDWTLQSARCVSTATDAEVQPVAVDPADLTVRSGEAWTCTFVNVPVAPVVTVVTPPPTPTDPVVTPTPTPIGPTAPSVTPTDEADPVATPTPTATDNSGTLPQTGAGSVGGWAAAGAIGLLLGIALMVLGGRRREDDLPA